MQVPAPNKLKYFANHVPVDGRSRASFRLFLNAVNLFRIEGRSKVDRSDELVLRTSFVCSIRRLRFPPWTASFPFVPVCFSCTTSKVHSEIQGEVRSHAILDPSKVQSSCSARRGPTLANHLQSICFLPHRSRMRFVCIPSHVCVASMPFLRTVPTRPPSHRFVDLRPISPDPPSILFQSNPEGTPFRSGGPLQ